ncbi:MAG: undecaprenyldiphospho-muramoylpentapeptide beta-N-acetylglucosaminyltransferase [Kiritimatiellae bacterium]|nr:undecaprenyldiphospho-muramoylpentapeptide beta-N-acetylglucosaminyltransferase [Kiritimatiellia bacterium]
MSQTKKKFVVACGGTGGHVFPGLAVANALRARGHEVCVWLSGRDIEQSTLNDWNGPIFSTGARQLSIKTLFALIRSLWICRREMRRFKPDAVLAMGSYSSLPPVLAAWTGKIPIMLHEANAVPGKAIDFLARFATRVAISFPDTAKWLRRTPTVYTGLPIRTRLIGQPPFDDIPKDLFTILVTGGSQGAHRVNELAAQAMCLLKKDQPKPFYVIHQCGKADEAWLKETYEKNGVQARVAAFIPEMGRAFASADFVVSRAGASTCFELCALGKAALLIPLPSAIRNHQHLNAEALVKADAADEADQAELTGRSLMRYLRSKMNNPTRVRQMALAMKTCSVPDADVKVAQALEAL